MGYFEGKRAVNQNLLRGGRGLLIFLTNRHSQRNVGVFSIFLSIDHLQDWTESQQQQVFHGVENVHSSGVSVFLF